MKLHDTREGWLQAAADLLRENVFSYDDDGVRTTFEVPEFRISVGWPKGKRADTKVIGECFNEVWSEDGVSQIFISPVLKDTMELLGCLTHEMIHAHDACMSGHRGIFAYIFKHIGMTGKRTETVAGEELRLKFADIAIKLGDYPHGRMRRGTTLGAAKKQSARMFKVMCADEDCGCTLRMARSWIVKGLPTCACGSEMLEV